MQNQRLQTIDVIKGLGCICIALLHFIVLGFRPQNALSLYLFVDIFALASGYIICMKYHSFVLKANGVQSFLAKRYKRIYIVYLPALVIAFIFLFMPEVVVKAPREQILSYVFFVLRDVLLLPIVQGSNFLLRQLWTVSCELVCYVLFCITTLFFAYLFSKITNLKNNRQKFISFGFWLHCGYFALAVFTFIFWFFWYRYHSASGITGLDRNTELYNINASLISGFYRVACEFYIGVVAYLLSRFMGLYFTKINLKVFHEIAKVFLMITLGYIFFLSSSTFTAGGSYSGSSFDIIVPLCFSFFLIFSYGNMSVFKGTLPKILSFFGRQSYSFYIWHILVYELLATYTNILTLNIFYAVFVMMFVTIILSNLSYKILESRRM